MGRPGPVVVESMSGQREGVNVRATGVFTHGDDRITLSLEFVLGPPARFVRGTHRSRIAGESTESPVSSRIRHVSRGTEHRGVDRRRVPFREPGGRFEVSTSVSSHSVGPAPVTLIRTLFG